MSNREIRNEMTRLDQIRHTISNWISVPLGFLSANQKFWIGFVGLCLATTLLVNNPFSRAASARYSEGDIARESIYSPGDITVVDQTETENIRKSAAELINPIFILQADSNNNDVQEFRSIWAKIATNNPTDEKSDPSEKDQIDPVLSARKFGRGEIDNVVIILEDSIKGTIYDDKDRAFLANDISLIDRSNPNMETTVAIPESTWTPLTDARNKIISGLSRVASFTGAEKEAFAKLLSPLVQPTVVYDSVATTRARDEITSNIEPMTISLKRGQKIVSEGDTITATNLSEIAAISSDVNSKVSRRLGRFFGLLLLISALYWIAWKFIEQRGYENRLDLPVQKTFVLFGFIVLIQSVIMAISFRLADSTAVQNGWAPFNDPMIWALAIPFAFASLLMTLLADRRTALFAGFFCAALAGMLAPRGLEFTIYASIVSAVAVYGIGRYRSRGSVSVAGLMIGVIGALTAISLIAYTQQPIILNTILITIGCALLGGLVTAGVTAAFLPITENLFGILTDVKLLELSNADLPVLGQLALRAPGTNQHSHAVGQLAEHACKRIGANGLLARIGALYHDIGKTAAPEHFVENQMRNNPHDKLKPAQSAKIIISHVTYGARLAKQMGLPEKIRDFIPQHHGTRTLHFFLEKAKTGAENDEEIHDDDFRYPGPKPQFKESAIMMIADSCEAAARSLAEPTSENIRYIVTKIIDAILSDDQLDECDLTLRELTLIRESMIRSLNSIYHSRIEYPGYIPPSESVQNILIPNESDVLERGTRYQNPEDIPIGKGGEIEDEAFLRSVRSGRKSESTD